MKISFNTPISSNRIRNTDGYGYATERILESLNRLGYEVTENDGSADIGFCFNQPQHWKFYGDQYQIGYHPWESTLLMPDWPGIMNECDEVWSPSPLIAEWYRNHNEVVKPLYVYEHGIDSVWSPQPRTVTDKVTFLHVGGEAYRKGLPETLRAFRSAFSNRKDDVQLTCKMGSQGFNLDHHGNVKTVSGKMPFGELLDLHYSNNVFVYPSWGEGFGFNPFQAMATGMPAIITGAWASYERFIDPNLNVSSEFSDSPWPTIHPGKMFKPDLDDLVEKMRYAVDNYDECHSFAQDQATLIHKEYSWDSVTADAFKSLEKRLENR